MDCTDLRNGANPTLGFLEDKAEKEQVFKQQSLKMEGERMHMEGEDG